MSRLDDFLRRAQVEKEIEQRREREAEEARAKDTSQPTDDPRNTDK